MYTNLAKACEEERKRKDTLDLLAVRLREHLDSDSLVEIPVDIWDCTISARNVKHWIHKFACECRERRWNHWDVTDLWLQVFPEIKDLPEEVLELVNAADDKLDEAALRLHDPSLVSDYPSFEARCTDIYSITRSAYFDLPGILFELFNYIVDKSNFEKDQASV